MKKAFLVRALGLMSDEDMPQLETQEINVRKSDDTLIHIPVSVQHFANKEEFVSAMTVHAMYMWELYQEIVEENEKIDAEQDKILSELQFEGKPN